MNDETIELTHAELLMLGLRILGDVSPWEPRGYDPYNSCDSYDGNLREFRREYPALIVEDYRGECPIHGEGCYGKTCPQADGSPRRMVPVILRRQAE